MKLITVRKIDRADWVVKDRNISQTAIKHFPTKALAVKSAKELAKAKKSIFAVINEENEPQEVMNFARDYKYQGSFVKDSVRRNDILKAVVRTAI